MKLDFRSRLLATTLLVSAGMLASPALAQDTPPAPDENPPETVAPVEGTTPPSTSATGEPVSETRDIVVTGSRIPQPNLTSSSPVTVISSQEVKLQGTTRTEDLINSLPQSFAAQGSNISNGATGTATVNLRGLGSVRTLVLINGRRLMPGDPTSPVADINFVPSALVKRVDVLTGGASSVYGADAVSGVVNFIMDTTFTGLRVDAQASVFNHDNDARSDITDAIDARGFPYPRGMSTNGGAQDISVAFGTGFDDDRGHIMGYATYRKQQAVTQATRDYSACDKAANSPAQIATLGREFSCGGSGTSALGTFSTNVGNFTVGPNRTFVTSNATTNPPFNFAPYNFFQRPDERYTFGVFAEYEVAPEAKPYLEAMFMNDISDATIAPSGNFFNTSSLNCNNPLLSAQQVNTICVGATLDPVDSNPAGIDPDTGYQSDFGNFVGQVPIFGPDPDGPTGPLLPPIIGFTAPTTFTDANGDTFNSAIVYPGRRNVEGGGRNDHLEHTAFRIVGGVRGDLDRGLSYDASFQFGRTELAEIYQNDFSVTRLGRALFVVTDPDTGQPVCNSVLDGTDVNCVPWDILAANNVSAESLAYLQTPGLLIGDVRETIANVNFTIEGGEYGIKLPWTDRGVGINVGGEYRKEALEFQPDTAFTTGDLAGQGGATIGVEGSFDVRELFGEVQVPIVNEGFIYDLNLSAGYRYSDYKVADNSFSTDTYKIAGEFAPIRDVRFRASYNRAVRAPNVVELFSAQAVGLNGTDDPCSGDFDPSTTDPAPSATAAQCALTGVSAAQFGNVPNNPANQYNSFLGGNPDLLPEVADSYTAGVVLQPRFLPGFAATVDYFDIRVKKAIGVIGFDVIIDQCINTGDPLFCDRIQRDAQGSLWLTPNGFIEDLNANIGGLSTKGVDVQASYAREIGSMGTANLSLVGTWLDELISEPVKGISFDCAGFFAGGCGTPNPEWRHKFRVGFTMPNGIGISGQWRYFSGVKNSAQSNDPDLANDSPTSAQNFPANRKIDAQSYFDLALTARIQDRFNFRLGANNILDKEPPIGGNQAIGGAFGNGNTFPQVYDALGRYLFAGVTVDF